jgi:MFS family permease
MQNSELRPTNVRWLVFSLACGTSWLLYLHRYAFALMKPKFTEEWGLSERELGLLDSAFSLSYTVLQFPLGIATDVYGVRLMLTAMILVWSTGLAMHASAASINQLWYARAVFGMGQSACFAALTRISRHWFPSAIRTSMQGLVNVFFGRVGGLSSYALFGFLLIGVLELDWRLATYLLAALGIVNALLFWVVFRNSPEQHRRVNDAERAVIAGRVPTGEVPAAPPRMTARQMLGSLTPRGLVNLVALNVQSILSTFADNIYSNWIPFFLWRVHSLEFKEMGIYSALPLLGGALGGFVGGALNDYFIRKTGNRRWSRSGVACFGKSMAAVLLVSALWVYDNPYAFCGLLFFVKLFGDWSLTTSYGVVTDIGGRATASVFALNNAIAGIGSITAPVIFGFVAHYYGWPVVFQVAAAAYLLCALSWLAINSTIPLMKNSS